MTHPNRKYCQPIHGLNYCLVTAPGEISLQVPRPKGLILYLMLIVSSAFNELLKCDSGTPLVVFSIGPSCSLLVLLCASVYQVLNPLTIITPCRVPMPVVAILCRYFCLPPRNKVVKACPRYCLICASIL